MSYYVASEQARRLRSSGLRAGRSRGRLLPAGVCHAVRPDDEVTACGMELAELVTFDEQPWGHGIGLRWCQTCEQMVPLS